MSNEHNRIGVLFVCMGNICRSPTVEAVFREHVARTAPALAITIDSAGTHDYHVGEPPDRRSQVAARRRGIELAALRARQLEAADFERFDYVLVMDERNLADARAIAPGRHRAELRLLLEFAPDTELREVPDPYYGSAAGFELVLDLAEAASRGLLEELSARSRAR